MESCYKIRLMNISPDDVPTLSYPLAYIHATFYQEDSSQDIAGELGSTEISDEATETSCEPAIVTNRTTDSTPANWPVDNYELKCMVQLCEGANNIEINAFGAKYHQRVIYKPNNITPRRFVRLVYIVCAESDGSFLSPNPPNNGIQNAMDRISLNAKMLQTFFAENLFAHGLDRMTFQLEEPYASPKVNVFHSKLEQSKAREMSGNELYDTFHQELRESELNDPLCKFWAFMSCTDYAPPSDPDEFDPNRASSYVKAHTALGGGKLALFGTGGLHTWASSVDEIPTKFTDDTMIDKRILFDDSCGRGTYWANYATTLGAAMHELGHCFDLAHTRAGIMGRGFDDMNKFFVSSKDKQGGVIDLAYYNGGSHWFRSSAVILRYHKWIDQSSAIIPKQPSCDDVVAGVYSDPLIRGPFGNAGPMRLKNQKNLDSREWCKLSNVALIGFVIYSDRYVQAVQFIGSKDGSLYSSAHDNSAHGDHNDDAGDNCQANENNDEDVPSRTVSMSETDDSRDDPDEDDHDGDDHEEDGPDRDDHDGDDRDRDDHDGDDHEEDGPDRDDLDGDDRDRDDHDEDDHDGDDPNGDHPRGDDLRKEKRRTRHESNHSSDEEQDDCPADGLLYSPIYGNDDISESIKHVFYIKVHPDERLTSIDVHAGAWVDAIRFNTNYRSSMLFGGHGGNHHRAPIKDGYEFDGLLGSYAGHIGSLGAALKPAVSDDENALSESPNLDAFHLESPGNIQIVEVQNQNGDVVKFFDFSGQSSNYITIDRSDLAPYLPCRLYFADDQGVISGFNVE